MSCGVCRLAGGFACRWGLSLGIRNSVRITELDLESLGLEDREIPYDKLTKLEKIGSGGFKDVYIGKFKGRKVAIAEFRDQLNASTSSPFIPQRLH